MTQQEELDQINRRYPQKPGEININRQRALSAFASKWQPDGPANLPDIPAMPSRFIAGDNNAVYVPPDATDSDRVDALQTVCGLGLAAAATGDNQAYQQIMSNQAEASDEFGDGSGSVVNIQTAKMKLMGDESNEDDTEEESEGGQE